LLRRVDKRVHSCVLACAQDQAAVSITDRAERFLALSPSGLGVARPRSEPRP
jgi:hypothetical protein